MRSFARRAMWVFVVLLALSALALLALAFHARRGPPLEAWHRIELSSEVRADRIGADYTWARYLRDESLLFDERDRALAAANITGRYRYGRDSPLRAPAGMHDWNRSYQSTPPAPRGGVLLLHGLSDSPYSVRHLVERYERAGFAVIAPRMPGHGTLPAGLRSVRWEDWMAVVRVALGEVRARAGTDTPLHIVGYSNGGALALKAAMDSVETGGGGTPRPDRVVLVSPMIGLAWQARYAQGVSLLADLPYFEQSGWVDVLPEFNPYKYNSFPVNAAVQGARLTQSVQRQMAGLQRNGHRTGMPPVLAFQSALDGSVSTQAVVELLFDRLPANGSELVLFDINRAGLLAPLLRPAARGYVDTLRRPGPRGYRLALITNAGADTHAVVERMHPAHGAAVQVRALPLAFPPSVYSLSHVAMPFPMDDPLYGLQPRMDEDHGIRLGTAALHGERGALLVSADQMLRLSCNPFFGYVADRIDQSISRDLAAAGGEPAPTRAPVRIEGTDALRAGSTP